VAARACAFLLLTLASAWAVAAPTTARQHELIALLRQDCGSCHGMTLAGGLGPALTPQALAGKSPQMLSAVILEGRPGTPMPPWRPFLSESEAAWLADMLKRGIGSER
jgi:cytochrome c55X